MKQTIALLPFLAALASAQDEGYKNLAVGDRVQVTFRSGGSLVGSLVPNPIMGPLSGARNRPKPVNVKAAASPFTLFVFHKKDDAASDAQRTVVDAWKRDFPEGTLTLLEMSDKASAEHIKTHNVVITPTVVFEDTASGRTQAQVGLQSAERLSAALGRLRARAEEDKIDFEKEDFLTLDVHLEYPGLNGTMSISKKDIREVRKLQKLDEATRKRLEEEHRKIKALQAAEEKARREAESQRSAESAKDIERAEQEAKEAAAKASERKALLEKAEKLKTQEELLKQFPPDQWNDERKQVILNKTQSKLPISPEERAFLDRQGEWSEAVKAAKAKKEKEAKEKTEEPK